jgi:hypothetical protein
MEPIAPDLFTLEAGEPALLGGRDHVCIIGAGIHPFGRTDGRSGREQGVYAVREALAMRGSNGPISNAPMAAARRRAMPISWSTNWA